MMNLPPRSARWFLCVAACLLLGLGIVIGTTVSNQEPDREPAVAAFAPAASWRVETTAPEPPTPAPVETTGENWFALDLAPTPSPSETAEAAVSPEQAHSPAPTATQEAGFVIELVRDGEEAGLAAQSPLGRVLIYHTHTYEAFEQTEADPYQETEQWRTRDEKHNMVRVGEELASLLRGMGVEVVHDTTAFEPPELAGSYTRSLEMLKRRKAMGESYDLYLDLHRDAYIASQPGPNAVSVGDGSMARIMMLVGKGEGQTAEGFEEKPQWQDNLLIAQRITDALNSQVSGLGKEVRMKSGRFNQHIAVGCLLIEVGNNRNTLQEALAAMPYLADAISQELKAAQEAAP